MVSKRKTLDKIADKQIASGQYSSIFLLVVLYLLQGVPLGLSFGSVPFLLKSKLNYSDLALFSLSSYPYSLKLLWSPIVDSLYFKSFGRRKSWIVPLLIGGRVDAILNQNEIPIVMIASVFTLMVFLCATQDIAVDGWAISLLTEENKTFASTAQTVGLNAGYFLSFTIFLAFNSPEFCNKYIRTLPADRGIVTLGEYLKFWGVMFLLCNIALILFKSENIDKEETESVADSYKIIWKISSLPHMRKFFFIMLIAKIGFIANESVTGLKLMEKGFNKEYLALSVLIDFPLQMIFGYYAAKWSSGETPLFPWAIGFYGRLIGAAAGMLVVSAYPENGVSSVYLTIVMGVTVFSSFMNTIQFVSMGSFFTKISDPAIGGTYMTLLNTFSNLGGTWPKYFILLAVDYFTHAPCTVTSSAHPFLKCSDDKSRNLCLTEGGTCNYISDGYYIVNTMCMLFGLVSMILYIKPTIQVLEKLPQSRWRVKIKKE